MRTIQGVCAVLLASLLSAACGNAGRDAEQSQPPPVEETVFGDMVGTLDEARAVEDTTQEHKQAIDRAVDGSAAEE